MGMTEKMETEVPRLDEFEREEIAAEPQEDELVQEEATEEEMPAEEEAPEEEQPPEKPAKPIKGPRFWAWLLAVPMMLFGLMMLVPSIWNTMLGLPALGGLIGEAGRNYESALDAYELLYNTDQSVQGFGLPGLTSGKFFYERRYVIWNKIHGPLAIVQNQPMEQIFPEGTRIPRGLRKLAVQSGELTDLLEGFYRQMNALGTPPEDQTMAEQVREALEALEAARALDGEAEGRALYYETIALQITASDPEQKENARARLEALRKNPAAAPWMYEELVLYYALQDGDNEAILRICDARLKRNRQDIMAMQYKVKALFLSGEEKKAMSAADTYGKRSGAETGMQLTKAELYYRQGKYDQALALCDEMLDAVDPGAVYMSEAELAPLQAAMEAARVKAVVLLLQGRPAEARDLLDDTMDVAGAYLRYMNVDFGSYIYTLLAAYIESGDEEGAAALEAQLVESNYEIPKAIADLREGKTTMEKIFTEGWGGFAA